MWDERETDVERKGDSYGTNKRQQTNRLETTDRTVQDSRKGT